MFATKSKNHVDRAYAATRGDRPRRSSIPRGNHAAPHSPWRPIHAETTRRQGAPLIDSTRKPRGAAPPLAANPRGNHAATSRTAERIHAETTRRPTTPGGQSTRKPRGYCPHRSSIPRGTTRQQAAPHEVRHTGTWNMKSKFLGLRPWKT